MQADLSPIDLQQSFPSLFRALAGLKHDPYEAGWLLGCVNDVAHCFIVAHARSSNPHGVNNPLSSAHEYAVAYLRDFGSSGGPESSVSFASLIDVDELITVVGVIHAAQALTNWSWTMPFTPVNGESRVRAAIDGMEYRFVALLYQAVIDFVFEGDAERMEIALLDWGWSDARETDYELYDDGNTTNSLVQFDPDDTPMEYIVVGPKVPSDMFCFPYTHSSPPEGACVICCYLFIDPEVVQEPLVLARCRARHKFHMNCLDEWVNGSSMENANRCPHDREVLCERRKRIHMGES
ncbi:hypothetical protein BKA63DRAFT_118331 [Paraphoma chrysanthemicola]|nr:hypothetical protein BKA63DRAFT_118331 [Paraphoma chrysanthemicola]